MINSCCFHDFLKIAQKARENSKHVNLIFDEFGDDDSEFIDKVGAEKY